MIYRIYVTGDYCAIEVYEYESFKQVGEFFGRLGSLTKFSDIVKEVIKYLFDGVNGRVLTIVENNSIGAAIIENLENDMTFDYTKTLYVDPDQKDQYKYGVNTNSKSKDQMVTIFYDYINTSPESIRSSDLIDQLSIIEKKANGSIASKHGYHDDLFMASCFCAYVKKKTILDFTYSTLDGIKTSALKQQEDYFLNNVLIKDTVKQLNTSNIFRSERELIKSMDDFDDEDTFVF